jgi:hypothetical protein
VSSTEVPVDREPMIRGGGDDDDNNNNNNGIITKGL